LTDLDPKLFYALLKIFMKENLHPFDFDGLENQMEGSDQPFDGVGTIVKRLLK
jgi:hypothetical protein